MGTIKIPAAEVLKKIYGETEESSARYTNLAVNFEKKYHHDKAEFFTAPGRTEIIGNHVDHNGGQIIAASIRSGYHRCCLSKRNQCDPYDQ